MRLHSPALLLLAAALLACGHVPRGGHPGARFPVDPLDPSEAYPGGATTHARESGPEAFSHPSANMSLERELDFKIGKRLFRRSWVSAPSSTGGADGLGPLFNARSCERCHSRDGRGQPPDGPDAEAVSLVLHLSVPPRTDAERRQLAEGRLAVVPEPTYGIQLQPFAIQGLVAEGRIHLAYDEVPVELGDGSMVTLRRPSYSIRDLGYGPLDPQAMLSPRIAPPMIGLGLLEAIPEQDILARADPDDADGDGISGRARLLRSDADPRVQLGRFGWKAGMPSVAAQTQNAFFLDIGMSNPLHPHGAGECSEREAACRRAADGGSARSGGLEIPRDIVDVVAFYARNLAVPARPDFERPEVVAGRRLFREIGCASCHVPSQRTRDDAIDPEAAGQRIWPYTDLLLHDMGAGLADGRADFEASGREWRTPPLWGLGLTRVVNGHTFLLHDGRARDLLEAVMWHGGEAAESREQVRALTAADRAALVAFLGSL
jgi:CxxC motif-containing protein (DUF1111 family)